MAGRRSVALRRPASVCGPGRSVGRGVGCRRMAQKRVARGSGAGRIAGARRAEALKEGRGAHGRVHNLDECAHKLAECPEMAALGKFVRAFVKFVNDWPAILPGCAAGHRGRPTPEQKSRQRIGFSSMGRIDRTAGSGEPQVKALASRWILRVRPKIRSFGGAFVWHRALTPPSGFFRVPLALFPAGQGAGPPGLPAGAPEGGPACRGAKYKTMRVMHKTAFSNEGMRGGEKSASFDARGSSLPSLYLEKVEHHETTTRRYAERQIPTAHPLSIPSKL